MKTSTLLKSSSKLAILSLATAVLFGCGGSGDVVTTQPLPATLTPPVITTFDVSGTITGLDGETSIVVNGETISQSVNGGFEFDDVVERGADVTITVPSDPFGQTCAVVGDSTFTNVRANVSGVVIDCFAVPVVNVRVQNFFTGENIDGANVTLSRQVDGAIVSESGTLNDDGLAAFELPLSGGRLSISADPVGFGAQTIVVETPNVARTVFADIFVQAVGISANINNPTGGDVIVDGDTLVSLPAASSVDATGTQIAGDLIVEVTKIDTGQSNELVPGDFLAQDPATGDISQLESFGAISVTVTDTTGNTVQLAADKTMTIRIPLAERAGTDLPPSLPLYYMDEDTGYWVEDGTADLATLPSGEQVYEATVNQIDSWMVARPLQTVEATGCAVDTDGLPIEDVRIQAVGADYIGLSRSTTNDRGVYTLSVPPNSSQFVSAFRGSQSRTLTVDSGSGNFTFSNAGNPDSCLVVRRDELGANSASMTLTWGENPRDLDTYFYGRPTVETTANVPFQIAYFRKEVTVNGQTIFLDVDDVTSFGPEIVTVPSFPYEGVYTYGVDLFAGEGTIASSGARVQINLGGSTSVYSVPEGEPTRCWAVMRFIVDAEGNATRETIGTWEDRDYCTSGVGIAGDTTAASSKGLPFYGDVNPASLKSE